MKVRLDAELFATKANQVPTWINTDHIDLMYELGECDEIHFASGRIIVLKSGSISRMQNKLAAGRREEGALSMSAEKTGE